MQLDLRPLELPPPELLLFPVMGEELYSFFKEQIIIINLMEIFFIKKKYICILWLIKIVTVVDTCLAIGILISIV